MYVCDREERFPSWNIYVSIHVYGETYIYVRILNAVDNPMHNMIETGRQASHYSQKKMDFFVAIYG